jgi:hypothetical protein
MKNEEIMSPNIIQKFSLVDATSVEVDSYFTLISVYLVNV